MSVTSRFVTAFACLCVGISLYAYAGDTEEEDLQKVQHEVFADYDMSYVIEISCEEVNDGYKTVIHYRESHMPTIYYDGRFGPPIIKPTVRKNEEGYLCVYVTFEVPQKDGVAYVAAEYPVERFYVEDEEGKRKRVTVHYKDELPRVVKMVPMKKRK